MLLFSTHPNHSNDFTLIILPFIACESKRQRRRGSVEEQREEKRREEILPLISRNIDSEKSLLPTKGFSANESS
jgi:hypothetical protein